MGYELKWLDKLLVIDLDGVVNAALLKSYQHFYSDERVASIDFILWDARRATEISLSDFDMKVCAANAIGESKTNASIRVAFLLREDMDRTAIDSFIETANRMSEWESKLYYSRDEADSWLRNALDLNDVP